MIELLSLIFGFGSSTIPYIFKYFQDKSDKTHEIVMTQMAMENNKEAGDRKLAEIEMRADVQDSVIAHQDEFKGGPFNSAMNASVPWVYAYAFLFMFFMVQVLYWYLLRDAPISVRIDEMWTSVDQSLMNVIITHYFGRRVMKGVMGY